MRKGWITVSHGQVHFRYAGHGPPVVLLHDSPRSSVLHIPVLEALAGEFTAIALDTPGYGASTPLPGPQPEIADFAQALGETVSALGLERCPIYAFHTSSKIVLELAASGSRRATVVVMDGLSIPAGGPDLQFIQRYMQPFEPSDDGSHVAAGWSRVRDFHRFFPWFAHAAASRLLMDLPDAEHLHRYATDLFMAGPHYVDAYAAAMRYDPVPALQRLDTPAVVMCREDDVLFGHLDRLPRDAPPCVTVERLAAERAAWLARLREIFRAYRAPAARFDPPQPLAAPADDGARQGYVDVGSGQLRIRRQGRAGARPLLLLHDLPGSSAQMCELMTALARDRTTYAPDLPGLGESDPIAAFGLAAYAAALAVALDQLGLERVDVYAEFLAGPIALALASATPQRIARLVLDGPPLPGAAARRALSSHYCPRVIPCSDGTHLLALWHRLRDQELAWPWYAHDRAAIRHIDARIDAWRLHEMLVDVMKQLANYGAAAQAAIDGDVRSLLMRIDQPVLLPRRSGDPRYAWVAQTARHLADATTVPWPEPIEARARVLREFLDA